MHSYGSWMDSHPFSLLHPALRRKSNGKKFAITLDALVIAHHRLLTPFPGASPNRKVAGGKPLSTSKVKKACEVQGRVIPRTNQGDAGRCAIAPPPAYKKKLEKRLDYALVDRLSGRPNKGPFANHNLCGGLSKTTRGANPGPREPRPRPPRETRPRPKEHRP